MAPTCFGPSGPSSGSIYWNLTKVTVSLKYQLKHIVKMLLFNLKKKLEAKKQNQKQQKPLTLTVQHKKKWVNFTYQSPLIRKVTNLFKQSNLRISLRATNTTFQQLIKKPALNNPSGIYKLKCNSCNRAYIGQSGRYIAVRHKEHV
jgi:hypothetical protein